MMKKLFVSLFTAAMFCALMLSISAETLDGTLLRSGTADPWIFYHDGQYYLTRTGTSRIAVYASDDLAGLATASTEKNISYVAYYEKNGSLTVDPTVYELFDDTATISGTWSPEIHYFSEEDFGAEYAGWYMFVGLRKTTYNASNTLSSEVVRLVVLKSTTDSPLGPYGHPTKTEAGKAIENYSQPLLTKDSAVYDEWACGQTILRIPEGEYSGIYALWVAEKGRGSSGMDGTFHQEIMIAKMKNPWTLGSEPSVVTLPTQQWETAGASDTHPQVVEGATPVYGIHGEVFLTYSGSGYWSDYGLGQLTWNGGDPLETSSWVKLPDSTDADERITSTNPIFTATTAENLRGAGHASFIRDTDGNGFFCYHAYAYDETKASSRDAYIEPYFIDYTQWNGTSYGVIRLGSGVAADTSTPTTFATEGEALGSATVTAKSEKGVTLQMYAAHADGYILYRSIDGETFSYLATTTATSYLDLDTADNSIYYYRVYPYREEEIGTASAIVAVKQADAYTLLDVLRILRYINGDADAVVYAIDDRDADGDFDLGDALLTLKYILNK